MKKFIALLMVIFFLAGCGEPEVISKGSVELMLSSTGLEDYDSIAVTIEKVVVYQGETKVELSVAKDPVELVALDGDKVYSFFKTSLPVGTYSKIELVVDEIDAYINGDKVIITGQSLVVETNVVVKESENAKVVVSTQIEDNAILASYSDIVEIEPLKRADIAPIGAIEPIEEKITGDVVADSDKELTAAEILAKPQVKVFELNRAVVDPETMIVQVGDIVMFNNVGKSAQTIYAYKPYNHFRGPRLLPGESWNYTFEEKGEYMWTTAGFQAWIKAKVIVE